MNAAKAVAVIRALAIDDVAALGADASRPTLQTALEVLEDAIATAGDEDRVAVVREAIAALGYAHAEAVYAEAWETEATP